MLGDIVTMKRCTQLRAAITSIMFVVASAAPFASAAQSKQTLTVEDAIQSARFVTDLAGKSVFRSPNGTRYVALTVKGDVAHDRVELDIYAGSTTSLADAKPRFVRALTTDALPL